MPVDEQSVSFRSVAFPLINFNCVDTLFVRGVGFVLWSRMYGPVGVMPAGAPGWGCCTQISQAAVFVAVHSASAPYITVTVAGLAAMPDM